MSERLDYCQYYLNKCTAVNVPSLLKKDYKNIDTIREAYENCSWYLRDSAARNRLIVNVLSAFMRRDSLQFYNMDLDANKVLQRSIFRINNASTYADIFASVSDYLWIKASDRLCKASTPEQSISLTKNEILENNKALAWIIEIKDRINNEKYNLNCMEEADSLPISKLFAPLFIENPDVAWYANAENISYFERKQRISDSKANITELEIVYYVFLITNIHHKELLRRYR